MRIIRPIEVTDAVLDASNIAEDDHPEWDSQATYSTGDRVIKAATHRVYESLADNNTDDPEIGVNAYPPTWLDIGPTNRWAPFDDKIGTVAAGAEVIDPSYLIDDTGANGVSYTFTPSALVDSVALINLSGLVLYVKVETTTEGIVYERRLGLSGGLTASNWWNYYFDPVERDSQAILTGFPVGLDATIHVAVSTDSGDAEIGALILGRVNPIGFTQMGSGFGIKDYSIKATDEFGNTSITRRGFSRRAEIDVVVDNSNLAAVDRILTQQRATPTVYIGDGYDPLVVYGFATDWFVNIESYPISELTISLEGLT